MQVAKIVISFIAGLICGTLLDTLVYRFLAFVSRKDTAYTDRMKAAGVAKGHSTLWAAGIKLNYPAWLAVLVILAQALISTAAGAAFGKSVDAPVFVQGLAIGQLATLDASREMIYRAITGFYVDPMA